jgi:NMD protein affecting ribosome stability and mRNA decay
MAPATKSHRHTEVTTHVLRQRAGVPYEIERKVCSSCRRVLNEKPLRRTTA